jgi:hypothetical protein
MDLIKQMFLIFGPKKLPSGQEDMKIKKNYFSTLVLRILLPIQIKLLYIENKKNPKRSKKIPKSTSPTTWCTVIEKINLFYVFYALLVLINVVPTVYITTIFKVPVYVVVGIDNIKFNYLKLTVLFQR